MAEYLLKHGADLSAKNYKGLRPVDVSTGGARTYLFYQTPSLERDLIEAIKRKDFMTVKQLIEKGTDINVQDGSNKNRPLHFAVQIKSYEITDLLLKNGAKIEAKRYYDLTSLHLAAIKGFVDIAELLIQNGADVNSLNNYQYTSLHKAVDHGHIQVVKLLIKYAADVNTKESFRQTFPLYTTAVNGNLAMAKLLLENGAIINEKNRYGETTLHIVSGSAWGDHRVLNKLFKFKNFKIAKKKGLFFDFDGDKKDDFAEVETSSMDMSYDIIDVYNILRC